ncbi:hypothetical protein TKK_0018963 [Trichogramma kaykai]|uniref:Uncharacterized protein n=1 Tax=Trichogramma kaykai TaxID=54128 RepID=A0ABD2VV56_9HYME
MNEDKDSVAKLIVYQQDLKLEAECIQKIIAKLDAQLDTLKVEQLNIQTEIRKRENATSANASTDRNIVIETERNRKPQHLDLSIPKFDCIEEDED